MRSLFNLSDAPPLRQEIVLLESWNEPMAEIKADNGLWKSQVRTDSVRTGRDTAADEAALPFRTITPKITPILHLILLNRCNLFWPYCSNTQHHQAGMTMRRLTGPLMLSAWMNNELQKQPKAFRRWHCDNVSDLGRFNWLASTEIS